LKILACFGLTLLLLSSSLLAQPAKVDSKLSAQLQSTPSDSLVPVWLVLPEVRSAAALRAVAPSRVNNRIERYRARAAQMRQDQGQAQAGLVNYLESLERRGLAAEIKPHWLVNIVEARLRPDQIDIVSRRPDIESVHAVPQLAAYKPTVVSDASSTAGTELNLRVINADDAWSAGYTGQGRIICSFDSGVEGDHPALYSNWKGHDGDSAAAWFDPLDHQSFPHTVSTSLSYSHGTHVMGILVGHDDATGDTIGVAPDAEWISAAVIDILGTSIIDAFEWAADPDRDPNTVDDLPDVINHSWGVIDIGCTDVFYRLIDKTEALGIVNIFAAGNEGPNAMTIRNPANRALDSLDNFAVGNVDARTLPPVIYSQSSRGPAECNTAIKPNVSAPGVAIRSSYPNGQYASLAGTSMAAPHVAGLVAMLREKNPNATVDEIKTAILTTTQTYGYSLPDNNYGWGVIDCLAALNALDGTNSDPNVRVYKFDHDPVAPGDQLTGRVVVQNLGASVSNLFGEIVASDPSVTVVDGTTAFSLVPGGDTVRASNDIVLQISDTVTAGQILSLDLQLTGSGYSKLAKLYVVLDPLPNRMITDLSSGKINFSVSNFGTYAMGDGEFFPAGGVGFRYNGSKDEMYECGLMIGQSFTQVSDGVRNSVGEPDGDFAVAPGGDFVVGPGDNGVVEHSWCRFNDSRAEDPIGVEITQETFGYATVPSDQLLIVRYSIKNTTSTTLSNLYAGLYLDWDIPVYPSNAGGYQVASKLLWAAYNNGSSLQDYRGVSFLDGTPSAALTSPASIAYYTEGFTEFEKYNSLKTGFASASVYVDSSMDVLQVIGVGPITLAPGDSTFAAFAFMGAGTLSDLMNVASAAVTRYAEIPTTCCVGDRGDVNADGTDLDPGDLSTLVDYLFSGGTISDCREETDINGDGAGGGIPDPIDLSYLVDLLFSAGSSPVPCP